MTKRPSPVEETTETKNDSVTTVVEKRNDLDMNFEKDSNIPAVKITIPDKNIQKALNDEL